MKRSRIARARAFAAILVVGFAPIGFAPIAFADPPPPLPNSSVPSAPAAPQPSNNPAVLLRDFSPDVLRDYASDLAHAEIAIIEPDAAGRTRQLTLFAWVPAPPELVRKIVLHPEDYPKFIRNVSKSEVAALPDGAMVNKWRVELPIGHFDAEHELHPAPEPDGPVDVRGSPGRHEAFRWQFLHAGNGTVLVHEGAYDFFAQNALLARLIQRNPAYEAGMAISAGLVLVKGIQQEAVRRVGKWSPPPTGKRRQKGFASLLARGTVAVVRSEPNGTLADVAIVDRVPVAPARLLEVVRAPDLWPRFLSSVKHAEIVRKSEGEIEYTVGVAGLIVDVDARFVAHFVPNGIDALAIGGDVPGSRYRWDLSPDDSSSTIAVYRTNAALSKTSGILRMLFRFEPLFEHSANVAVGVIVSRAMAWRAKQIAAQPRSTPTISAPNPK